MLSKDKSTIYMLHLSDGSLRNGITNKRMLLFNLKMNLLFFDELFIGAPALLRNHVLFDMSQTKSESESLGEIYSKYIRPILIEGNKDIITVAQNMIDSDKPIGLSDLKREKNLPLIMTHAEFVKEYEPDYFPIPKENFREEYYNIYKILVEKYNTDGVWFWSERISPNSMQEFLKKLNDVDKDTFRVTDAYSLTNKYASGLLKNFLRTVAFTTMEHFMSPHEIVSGYSLNRLNTPIINDYYESIWGESLSTPELPPNNVTDEEKIPSLYLPLDRILDLSFSEILKLRKTPLFTKLRKRLHRCNLDNIDNLPYDIYKIYNETIEQFEYYIAHSNIIDRMRILDDIKKRKKQLWINIISQILLALGISFPYIKKGFKEKYTFITFILRLGGALATGRHIQVKSDNNVYGSFQKITDEQRNVVYRPGTGNATRS